MGRNGHRARLVQAIKLKYVGKPEEARQMLLELVEEYPDEGEVLLECAFIHDELGMEREAIHYYVNALEYPLPEEKVADAYICYGSTLRAIGEYNKAKEVLEEGKLKFPDNRALEIFLGITLHNLGESSVGFSFILKNLLETTTDQDIKRYQRALSFYAENLEKVW